MSKLTRINICHRTVEGLRAERDTLFWDRRLPGFGVRVYATGAKVYVVQVRHRGRARRMSVGRHGVIAAEAARKRAAKIIVRLKSGEDADALQGRARAGPTVGELARRYLEEHVEVRCKPTTADRVRSTLKNHLLPAFGPTRIAALEPERVWALRNRMHATPGSANHAVNTLSAMFNLAGTWGLVSEGTNPCVEVGRYRIRRRERFLTGAEFERLGAVLNKSVAQGEVSLNAADAIRLLMLTGCRKTEILALRWEEVDFERGELRLADSKTGPRTVPLSPAAGRILRARWRHRSADCGTWVFPGRKPGTRLRDVGRPWRKLRSRVDLPDVRLHDLRHSFASRALALGESLPAIGRLLGHTEVQTTARYAHLAEDSVREAAARVAASIGKDILPARAPRARRRPETLRSQVFGAVAIGAPAPP